ncbi:hypothetical protein TWF569_009945 [Orbilia oligospora]|uniref:Uncharacterized protein n=1 Tax=Orbilia oligospora TaxID=2813651 RepID=A0A7C8JD71_ORBOL|nr:hypothetical protein TWF103_003590 [Orbilia oligospora]KAF3112128.1 hypothetical protein TWF102_005867 [Orbilia oligospora]KAF3135278.1 hypothetical protein TWF569_009945 [Orbilia oligospora]KAF3148042.1 hypothetical protein TWF594_001966 [Orbilia oligospora]
MGDFSPMLSSEKGKGKGCARLESTCCKGEMFKELTSAVAVEFQEKGRRDLFACHFFTGFVVKGCFCLVAFIRRLPKRRLKREKDEITGVGSFVSCPAGYSLKLLAFEFFLLLQSAGSQGKPIPSGKGRS